MARQVRAAGVGGGGSGFVRRKGRSLLDKIGRAAGAVSQLSGAVHSWQERAADTAYLEAYSAAHREAVRLDSAPEMMGVGLEAKAGALYKVKDDAVAELAKRDRRRAAELSIVMTNKIESLLGDDRKNDLVRMNGEAMTAIEQTIATVHDDTDRAAQGLLDSSDPKAPERALAVLGGTRKMIEVALRHLPEHVRIARMAELERKGSQALVSAFLRRSGSDEDFLSWSNRLREGRDVWQVPGGGSFNLTGRLTQPEIEDLIKSEYQRRSDQYALRRQKRTADTQAEKLDNDRAVSVTMGALHAKEQSVEGVRRVIRDPTTPPAVRERLGVKLDTFLNARRTQARNDASLLVKADEYRREMRQATSFAETQAVRDRAMDDPTMVHHMPEILSDGRAQDDALSRAAAQGPEELDRKVTFTKLNRKWQTAGKARTQRPGEPQMERTQIDVVLQNPQMVRDAARYEAGLDVVADRLDRSAPNGAARPFLDIVMPMAYGRMYDVLSREGSAEPYNAQGFKAFMDSLMSQGGMKAFSQTTAHQRVDIMVRAGLLPADTTEVVHWTDDGSDIDYDRTYLRLVERDRRRAAASGQRQYGSGYTMNTLRSIDALGTAAGLASGRKYVTDHEMQVSP